MKRTGLLSTKPQAAPKHIVPPNVSGQDVSSAVARLPQMPESFEAPPAAETAPSSPAPSPSDHDVIFKVDVDLLDDSPYQPRLVYEETALSLLGESLMAAQEEAIVVKAKPDGRYELVSGHRRTRAARMWGIPKLDARFFRRGDEELAISALVTNDAKEDLTDYERGKAYLAILDAATAGFGSIKNQDQLAKRLGKSKGLISGRIALTKLPDYVIEVLEAKPNAVNRHSLAEFKKVIEAPHDRDLLVECLHRVGNGEITMTALMSIMAARASKPTGGSRTQAVISLQKGTTVYAQLVQDTQKRKLTINIPRNGIDLDEASKVVAEALAAKFGAGSTE